MALVVAVWAAFASGDGEPSPSTTAPTSTSAPPTSTTVASTSTTSAPTTSTTAPPTSTTTDEGARVEEVRLILEDLYFRWFQAIYNNDEEAVRDVIATQNNLSDFRSAVENLELPRSPELGDITVRDINLLRDDPDCLVAEFVLDLSSWRGEGMVTEGVDVLLRVGQEWRFGTSWESANDLWQEDCEIEPDLQ